MGRLGATVVGSIALCGTAAIAVGFGVVSVPLFLAVVAASLGAIGAVVAWGSADPGLQMFGPALLRADTGRREVALTYDDGPDPASTPALLDALREADARATFFLLVDRAEAHPDLTRAIARHHQVGLHGASHHPWLTVRSIAAGTAELRDARRRLEELTGRAVTTFRPPFGAISPRLVASAAAAGLEIVWCSVRTRDGGDLAADVITRRAATAGPGDIVLLHEGRATTAEATPRILAELADRGLRSVTVEALCASS